METRLGTDSGGHHLYTNRLRCYPTKLGIVNLQSLPKKLAGPQTPLLQANENNGSPQQLPGLYEVDWLDSVSANPEISRNLLTFYDLERTLHESEGSLNAHLHLLLAGREEEVTTTVAVAAAKIGHGAELGIQCFGDAAFYPQRALNSYDRVDNSLLC